MAAAAATFALCRATPTRTRFGSKRASTSVRRIAIARGTSGKDDSSWGGPGLWYVDEDEANAKGEHPEHHTI